MSERIYLFLVGLTILIALYFEIEKAIYALCLFLIFEAITNLRLTTFSQKLLKRNVDAFLVWRMLVAVMLGGSFLLLNQYNVEIIWFIPWFMGFAILGAGLSGVCPAVLFIRWIGFR